MQDDKILYRGNFWDVLNENDHLADGTPAVWAERFRPDSTYETGYFIREQNGKYKRVSYYIS